MRAINMKQANNETKKAIAMNGPDLYGQRESRERLGLTNAVTALFKLKKLEDVVFTSDALYLEKKTETKRQSDLALLESKQKRQQVIFKHEDQL